MIAYSIVKETLNHTFCGIRYFLKKEDADKYCKVHNWDSRIYPRYYTEAIVVEEEYTPSDRPLIKREGEKNVNISNGSS